jgi:hypothetical protein
MADYRALAQALDPYAMDTGGITPDTLRTLQSGYKSPNLLGMIADIGRGGLSNLESLVRGGVAQFAGTPVDTLNTIRTPYPMEVMGDVNYAPDKQVYGGTKDILGMLPQRVTKARPETAGMEELGTVIAPGLAKGVAPVVKGGGNLLGMAMNERMLVGQPILPSLLKEPQTAMFAVNPQEQMAQAITKAEVSPLGFYSAVEQQALKIPRKQGTGDSFLNDLMKGQDVKKYEIEAMGLEDYLRGKPNVTRQEVQDFIQNNRINVQERQLGGEITDDPVGIAKRKAVFDKYEPEILRLSNALDDPNTYASGNHIKLLNEYNRLQDIRNLEADAAYTIPEVTPTKYNKYQLPGGENYREILLTTPTNMNEYNKYTESLRAKYGQGGFANLPLTDIERAKLDKFYANEDVKPYQSSHYDEPNILAHMRVNDRVDAEGKKMLLIEEVQSDWHQAGREKGYDTPERRATKEKALNDLLTERQKLLDKQLQLEEMAKPFTSQGKDAPSKIIEEWSIVANRLQNLQREQNRLGKVVIEGVPNAPFKDTWHQLALKRALKEAVDKGYDRIGLTTGKQQIDRFSDQLRQNVDQIDFSAGYPNQGTTTITATKNGQPTFEGNVVDGKFIDGAAKGKSIDEVLGKSIAQKILSHDSSQGLGTIKGDDLTIGGEGMKKYYNEIYPAFLNKIGKKYGAQVGETQIPTDRSTIDGMPSMYPNKETVRYLDITPEMRKAIKEGQPLASIEDELAKALA